MLKMRNHKLIALLLCFAMIITSVVQMPVTAFAESEITVVNQGGKAVSEVLFAADESTTLSVAGNGSDDVQWQIYSGEHDLWADIYGEDGKELTLTYAKVAKMMDGGKAKIRCTEGEGESMETSNAVSVTVSPASDDETAEEPAVFAARPAADTSADVSAYAGEDEEETPEIDNCNIIIQYRFDDGEQDVAAEAQTYTIEKGGDFSATVNHPQILGYYPKEITYPEGVTYTDAYLELNYTDVQDDIVLVVWYAPGTADYTVIHYVQETTGDNYREVLREHKTGTTGTRVGEVAKVYFTDNGDGTQTEVVADDDFEGLYSLIYEHPAIAADGSTVVEIYYDRYYYMMAFPLDGGYGVEPFYARYGAAVDIGIPTKAGYVFDGWTPSVPATVPVGGGTYTAKWTDAKSVNYTVVYWQENADDDGYSYWGSEIKQATAGTYVDGSDSLAGTTAGKTYFSYYDAKTDKDVYVEGDGSTIVNVYYKRNYYTIKFTGYGTCGQEEHTHGDGNCVQSYVCGFDGHVHTDACLSCELEEHTHGAECCSIEYHKHGAACCTIEETVCTHYRTCYEDVSTSQASNNEKRNAPNNPGNGYVYRRSQLYSKIIYINGTWYKYSGDTGNGEFAEPVNCPAHTHGDGDCNAESCEYGYEHTHASGCDYSKCDITLHTHGNACYANCNEESIHQHTESCLGDCVKPVHTHVTSGNNRCDTVRNGNVLYVITAKYEQTIGDIWPTYDLLAGLDNVKKNDAGDVVGNSDTSKFRGWTIPTADAEAVSKRITMTSDLCDSSGSQNATANYGGTYTYRLYYLFESFDQDADEDGHVRREYTYTRNNKSYTKYFDSDNLYYQELQYSSNTQFGQKDITGMTPVGVQKVTEGNIIYNYLYYERQRYTLSFQNVDTVVESTSDIMYGQPLSGYEYRNDDGGVDPPYPSGLEPNAYVFDGWYTTPECYTGTEFNFATGTMPNNNLTLYANWVPTVHTVTFYMDEEALAAGEQISGYGTLVPTKVAHGQYLGSTIGTAPEIPSKTTASGKPLTFLGWFYIDDKGEEKAMVFEDMPINRDLQVYGKWSSSTLNQYIVYFEDEDGNQIAEPVVGSALVGTTKTFSAKVGNELKEGYRELYFPESRSHSITVSEDETANTYTFVYVKREAMPYTVKYVDKDTGQSIIADKEVPENRSSVVTETYVPKSGYKPDAYSKRLVVNADGDNVLIFYYTKNATESLYKIGHYIEISEGVYEEYDPNNAANMKEGTIGQTYSAESITIDGYDLAKSEVVNRDANGNVTVTENVSSGRLSAGGMEINFYYDRKSYPYKVRYLEYGTGNVLAPEVTKSGQYGDTIIEDAIDIPGYEVSDPLKFSQSLVIRVEKTENATVNVITFYYKELSYGINYEVAGPDGCAELNIVGSDEGGRLVSEQVPIATGTPHGAKVTYNPDHYEFKGWFLDSGCTGEPISRQTTYVPPKLTMQEETLTYYAGFEEKTADLSYVAVGPDGAEDFGSVDKDSETVMILTGEAAGSTASAGEGYRLEGWYTDEACTPENRVGTELLFVPEKEAGTGWTSGTTYYAKFVEDEAALNYVAVGPGGAENFGSVTPETETVDMVTGEAAGSTAAAEEGYVFAGWYSDAACTEADKISEDADFVPVKGAEEMWADGTTYYAKFVEDKADLNYVAKGPEGAENFGFVTPETETVDMVTGEAAGSTARAGAGYRFTGWYDAEGNQLAGGDVLTYVPEKEAGTMWADGTTYYAVFEEERTTISYVAVGPEGAENFGSVSSSSEEISVVTGTPAGSTAIEADSRYKFAGWYDNPLCAGNPVSESADFVPAKKPGESFWTETTYYAKFQFNEVDITYQIVGATAGGQVTINGTDLTADKDNPSITEEDVRADGSAAGATAAVTNSNYYEFDGWYADEECTVKLSNDAAFVPEKTGGVYKDATYYAKFNEKQITVTYKVAKGVGSVQTGDMHNSSAVTETIGVISGQPAGAYAIGDVHQDYHFQGWYFDEECTIPVETTADGEFNYAQLAADNSGYVTPLKTDDGTGTYRYKDDIVLYAKFVSSLPHITIAKEIEGARGLDESFMFNVKNIDTGEEMNVEVKEGESVVLRTLPVGTYEITEIESWSWRYDLEEMEVINGASGSYVSGNKATIVLTETSDTTVKATNVKDPGKDQWLDASVDITNLFTPKETVQIPGGQK